MTPLMKKVALEYITENGLLLKYESAKLSEDLQRAIDIVTSSIVVITH